MSGGILFEAIVFLVSAILFVPLSKKFGLSSVLGYLIAGICIGPYVLNFVGSEGQDIMHFAEFGVVIMLFLIGLEIDSRSFWKMRKTILGMGGGQLAITFLLSYGLFLFLNFSWQVSVVISMAVVLSSTAIVLQSLKEKGLFDTAFGSSSFSILLFQDIIVIPMLAIIPLLSSGELVMDTGHDSHGSHGEEMQTYLLENLPLGVQTIAVILSVVLVVLAGRYLFVPMLRLVATTRLRELLTASALLIVLALAFSMELVGLSPALGAFLGGVVLATSEYRHELVSNLEPFKGMLLGLFFMAVGASINFMIIKENPLLVSGLVFGIIALKAVGLFLVGTIFKMKMDQKLLLAVALAQIGEFAFVLLSFASQLNIIGKEELDLMLVVTALTMTLAPILGVLNERIVLPRVGTKESARRTMDHIAKQQKVILLGFGHFGSTIGRFLRSYGVEATILDHDSNRVDLLRKMGFEVYYGDATRMDLLESAGIAEAEILICALDNPDVTMEIISELKENYPNLKLMVRAKSRFDAYDLLNLGVQNVYRESLESSIKVASDVLNHMGFRKYTIHQQAQNFIKYDEESLKRLAEKGTTDDQYVFRVKEEIALQEKLLEQDLQRGLVDVDHPWNSESISQDNSE